MSAFIFVCKETREYSNSLGMMLKEMIARQYLVHILTKPDNGDLDTSSIIKIILYTHSYFPLKITIEKISSLWIEWISFGTIILKTKGDCKITRDRFWGDVNAWNRNFIYFVVSKIKASILISPSMCVKSEFKVDRFCRSDNPGNFVATYLEWKYPKSLILH